MAVALQRFILFKGETKHFIFDGMSTPGLEQTLIDELVPAGKVWKLWAVTVTHRFESDSRISHDAQVIDCIKTGPGNYSGTLNFLPAVPIAAGEHLLVKFTALLGEPINHVCASVIVTEENI